MLLNQRVGRFMVRDPGRLEADFLFHWLRLPDVRATFEAHAYGAAQPNISPTLIEQQTIPLPPLAVQRRIASILGTYDDLIEVNRRRIAVLEEMAWRLFEEWFVRFRLPGAVAHTDSAFGAGGAPRDWEPKKLRDLVELVRRPTRPGPDLEGRRYVPIECLPPKSLALLESKPIEEAQSSLQLFEKNEILFGAMRPYFHKVVVAPFPGVTRTTCFVFKPMRPEWHAFATLTLFRDATVAYANAHSRGATIPYAVWDGSLAEMPLLLPHAEVLKRFDVVVAPLLSRLRLMFHEMEKLHLYRDLLLPRLMSGDLPVTAAECELEAVA